MQLCCGVKILTEKQIFDKSRSLPSLPGAFLGVGDSAPLAACNLCPSPCHSRHRDPGSPWSPSSASPNLCEAQRCPAAAGLCHASRGAGGTCALFSASRPHSSAPVITAELKPLLSFVSIKVKEESSSFKCQEEAFHPLVQEDFEQ